MAPQPEHIPEPPADPPGFEYRLLRDEDREEALLIKVHALEQEHFALSNNFTLYGVAGPPTEDNPHQFGTPEFAAHELAAHRATRKKQIEEELAAIYARVDEVIERAKANGRTVMEEARAADAKRDLSVSAITGKPINLSGKGQLPGYQPKPSPNSPPPHGYPTPDDPVSA